LARGEGWTRDAKLWLLAVAKVRFEAPIAARTEAATGLMADAAAIGGGIWGVRRVLEWLSGEEVVLSVLE
jgi:hypothetical protein